ncbi:MAG: CHAT domain-containing protein [Tildeniella torsiva UHER 1998/13D]|jgi:tetratricopeptide (TPR) repeat protein|nr:CHAT domain-containing protein [Tildeniella torsiva UHER 1998/13D]
MALELNLRFPDPSQVVIKLGEVESDRLDFASPLSANVLEDIRWYLEVYSAQYTADVDDQRAEAIAANLSTWGAALFEAVFSDRAAQRLLNTFQDSDETGRLITISARHPAILGLPWELLRDPAGTYLLHETPRISVRRRLAGAGGGRSAFRFRPQASARILFVISRPSDAGFINPRSEAQAIMRAIAAEAAGRVDVEFLRPATLDALVQRLEDTTRPRVDILHFDGHGVYDADGRHWEDAKLSDRLMLTKGSRQEAQDVGYLLFETAEGTQALISAETLGDMLHRQQIGLMVLSACQSAAVGSGTNDDSSTDSPGVMGSLAARLTHAGIPAVLAMTHSVLVAATEALFGQFYQNLGRGQGMGEALDNARRYLYRHPERGTRLRGQSQAAITLRLQDWFLPALYQAGTDTPLLLPFDSAQGTPSRSLSGAEGSEAEGGNLPEMQEAGFWGRSRELWQIERAFVQGTRRLTISGFGGQGKTYLAQEAGRWLHQTGLFERVCFVDYAAYQGQDPVSYAVSTLATVLGQSLIDASAATAQLRQTATLVILDNLEALEPGPQRALLDAAKPWSEAGHSRVLLTTRQPDLAHPDYKTEGSRQHICLPLRGLGSEIYPNDALDYFAALRALPPAPATPPPDRAALVKLFALVDFHPLSMGLLGRQLKTRRIAEVGQRLAELLQASPVRAGEAPNPLVASLMLSLDRLDDQARQWLPRLGVFQGGAFEDDLLAITGLGLTEQESQALQTRRVIEQLLSIDPRDWTPDNTGLSTEQLQQIRQAIQETPNFLHDQLAQLPDIREFAEGANETTWPALRQALESTGLIQAEYIPGIGVPYLKFHPTLAPVLWAQVPAAAQADLQIRHRQRYYQLSGYLYQQDRQNPLAARAIARRELPNLMQAVNQAIAAADPDAVDFGDNVNRFLEVFGLGQDRAALAQKLGLLQGEAGSRNWYLARSNQGETLLSAGRYGEALALFTEVLQGLGEAPSYEQCVTLTRIGRCFRFQGQAAQAAECYRAGIALAEQLEPGDSVTRQRGFLHTDLGDVLREMGNYAGAKDAYEESLRVCEILDDARGAAVNQIQLGSLFLVQKDLAEAATRYQAALKTFQGLREPASEAVVWHQLGMVYQEARQWDEAERHYRESARLKEEQGMIGGSNGAVTTWNQLANLNQLAGRVEGAIAWYEKAIAGGKAAGDSLGVSVRLSNLANLLQSKPHPSAADLATARHHAEAALAIKQTLDPAAAEIWKTYGLLGAIADKQGQADPARAYRQQARQAKAAFAGTQYELQRHGQLIGAVSMAALQPDLQAQLEPILHQQESHGWTDLVAAIRRILNGERDEDSLVEPLDTEDSMIVSAILQGIADPTTLQALLSDDP